MTVELRNMIYIVFTKLTPLKKIQNTISLMHCETSRQELLVYTVIE